MRTRAPTRAATASLRTLSKSPVLRPAENVLRSPMFAPKAGLHSSPASTADPLDQKAATEVIRGTICFSNSKRFPLRSGVICDNPVTFPTGRAKLLTIPIATGSPTDTITIGISAVAFFAVRVSTVTVVTMTSTFSRIRLITSSGRRSFLPSAYRYSMVRFFSSIHPASRKPSQQCLVPMQGVGGRER